MSKSTKKEVNWLSEVEAHDYPAAKSYLSIIYNPNKVAQIIIELNAAARPIPNLRHLYRYRPRRRQNVPLGLVAVTYNHLLASGRSHMSIG